MSDTQAIMEMDALQELTLEIENDKDIQRVIAASFSKEVAIRIFVIADSMASAGLSFVEACVDARVDPKKMERVMAQYPVIAKYFSIKEIEYKKSIMNTITEKAREQKDGKLALWLLEKRYPEEFNTKKGSHSPVNVEHADALKMAVEFVQSSEAGGLVSERRAKVTIGGTQEVAGEATPVRDVEVEEPTPSPVGVKSILK